MPNNILEEYNATSEQRIDDKTEIYSVTTKDVGLTVREGVELALLYPQADIVKTYPKDFITRDVAYNLFISLQNNVSGDTANGANWQPLSSNASQSVYDLGVISDDFANGYEATVPPIASYSTSNIYLFKPDNTNTGASTLQINALAVLPIKKYISGAIANVAAGDLNLANTYLLIYKTTYFLIASVSSGGGGVSTFSALTDSPYDNTLLAEALDSKQDRLAGIVSGCEITVETFAGTPVATNKQIRVTSGTWYIPTSERSKLTDTVSAEITLCVTGGDFKYYDIVADNTSVIIIHEGTPSTSPAHYVIDPLTEVLLGFITVGDAVIEEPTLAPTAGLETFTESLTIASDAINLNCQNKAFPVFYVTGFGTSPLNITISNDYGVVEATLIISTSSYPNGLITLPFVSYPSTYQPSGETSRIVLKMNWVVGNFIWTITEQPNVDKQNIQQVKSADFSAENNNNYTTTGTVVVTEPSGVTGKGYSVIVISGTTTIDSISYSTAGTKITRLYNGSIWLTKVEIASGGVTNLGYTPSPTNGIVTSDTGTDATIPLADGTDAGLSLNDYTSAEKTKLFGIATGANVGVVPNIPVTGATKTKITYDNKGLVTAGADATTSDIADSTNKRYQTDTQSANNDATSSIQTQINSKQATLTAANFATFVNSTTDKTTPVDADILPTVDVSTGKRFSLINLWTNYLKPKADAIYATISNLNLKMNLSMSARTIKLNKTASTANGIDGSVTDLMELMAGATTNAGTGTLSAVSTTNTKSIAFSAADIITGFASGSDGAYLFVQNKRLTLLVLNHEDGTETASNRIVTGGQNLSLGTYASVILQYRTSNNRWNIVASYGIVYWSFLAGTGNRAIEVDANGVGSATKTFIDLYITDSTNITNLETTANWTAGVYGGATIAGETKGKVYYGTLYMYVMITASTPKRIIYT